MRLACTPRSSDKRSLDQHPYEIRLQIAISTNMNVLLRYCRLIYVFTYLLYLSFNSYLLIYSFSGIPDWKESAQYERLMKKKKPSRIRFSFSSNTILWTSSSALRHIKNMRLSKMENCSIERNRSDNICVYAINKFLRFDGYMFCYYG